MQFMPSLMRTGIVAIVMAFAAEASFAQGKADPDLLKSLSLEELMELEVTSVSRHPERMFGAASAVQILTNEMIARSGASRLPEALRLAPNLQVAQVNSHDWAITARGFNGAPLANNSLADKLLVMIDGRSIYTPLFGGVFWDVQNVLLEDVERIEVISGPGGTLWGANAVNGVINVVTRSARDTQGAFATVSAGSFLRDHVGLRYGTQIGRKLFIRFHGQRMDYRNTTQRFGTEENDEWGLTQGGFRADYYTDARTTLTVQGDVYGGSAGSPENVSVNGQNLVLRWARSYSPRSSISVQAYADRTWRRLPGDPFQDELWTYDLDFQHHFPLSGAQNLIWGATYRLMRDDVQGHSGLMILPRHRTMHLFSGFLEDEIRIIPRELTLHVGTKLEHNTFSGFELQPGARVAWTPDMHHTVWGAVSRAIRSPARLDVDLLSPDILGQAEFDSEKLTAFELGYRTQPIEGVVLSASGFYNLYHDLRSVNVNPAPPPGMIIENDHEATSWGVEVLGSVLLAPAWQVRGGYTFLDKKIEMSSPAVVPGSDVFEGIDPHHQVLLQSSTDLPGGFEFDVVGRFVDVLPPTLLTPRVPPYATFDVRVAWDSGDWEISLVGQNLAREDQPEFGDLAIPRGLYGTVSWRP